MEAIFLGFIWISLVLLAFVWRSRRTRGRAPDRLGSGRDNDVLCRASRICKHPPPVRVALPVPTRGWRWRRQEPEAGSADALGLLAEASGAAEIAAPGIEAREREPLRLGGYDLRLERGAGLTAQRASRQLAIHAAHVLGDIGQAQAPLR